MLELIPRIHRATHAIALALASDPKLDVTQAEAHVLAHLHEHGTSPLSDLHARFGHRRSTLTSVLDRLEERKLIERRPDPQDRRSFLVVPTRAGRAAGAAVHKLLSAIETAALAGLPRAQRSRVVDAVDAVAASADGRRAAAT